MIWVWSTHAASKSVVVQLQIGHVRWVEAPRFTVCPSATGATCRIGVLPKGQADELEATAFVRKQAVSGEQIELTAGAAGEDAHAYSATGSLYVTAPSTTPTGGTTPPPETQTLPPVTVAPYPGATDPGGGLFPTVSPSASSTGLGFPSPQKSGHPTRVRTASAIVPLDPKLIGGQLAGLAILAGGVMIAIARLSLRRPRPAEAAQDAKSDKGSSSPK